MPSEDSKQDKPNILELAKKKRHIYLLQKIQQGGTLSSGELRELQKLEGTELPAGVVDTQEQVAKAFRVTLRTVQRWIREGMPKTSEGFYDVIEVQAWRILRGGRNQQATDTDKEKWDTKFRQMRALLAEMEYKKRLGELITREEVEQGRVQRILAVKKALLSLPRRVAPQVVSLDVRSVQTVLEKRIHEIIDNFARGNG
jgi:phage terminase Nu1 subunit (DNA packaging protein)